MCDRNACSTPALRNRSSPTEMHANFPVSANAQTASDGPSLQLILKSPAATAKLSFGSFLASSLSFLKARIRQRNGFPA